MWIPADASWLGRARELVDSAAADVGFDDGSRHQIKVATNEAVANAIEHGAPCSGGRVRLQIVPEAGALTVCVSDCGTFSGDASPEDPLPEHGRGLTFMELLMDEVELDPTPERTLIRLHKRIDADPALAVA